MRVTESRLMEIAQGAVGGARDAVGRASQVMASGVRVALPSDDPTAWAEGMRASARATLSTARGNAVARARDRLSYSETLLQSVGDALKRVNELAVQMSSGTLNASDRQAGAIEVQSLHDAVLAAANQKDAAGEYLFAGSLSTTAPFDAAGDYVGDTTTRQIEAGEGYQPAVTITGAVLTASSGVDVLKTIAQVAAALGSNDTDAVRAALDPLGTAVAQVADAHAAVGTQIAALDSADTARKQLEETLAGTHARTIDADPVAAASDFTEQQNALASARALAAQIINLVTPPR